MNNMDVFQMDSTLIRYDQDEAVKVITRKIDKSLIEERKQGGATLSYIGGSTVIDLLNEAFNYQWSFEIVREEVVESLPKLRTKWNREQKKNEPVIDEQGNKVYDPQPPVAKVLGRLTVPGLGIKEQYGSKVIIGGATEQESSFKAASTDAMKKCATLFGIGNELYRKAEQSTQQSSQTSSYKPQTKSSSYQTKKQDVVKKQEPVVEVKKQEEVEAASNPNTQAEKKEVTASSGGSVSWNKDDIQKLKELKAILGITENKNLDPYVREYLDSADATHKMISKTNIAGFNNFLSKKINEE
ncbi:DNA repair protein [Bacillus phage vB_BauM_KLEB27-3]|nr:DNA repair protein [Bacillus phage vB_BauM_KLEB27-3]